MDPRRSKSFADRKVGKAYPREIGRRVSAALRIVLILACAGLLCPGRTLESARIARSEPFEGVTHYRIHQEQPRQVAIQLLKIDPAAPGIGFFTTPSNGDLPGDTVHERTRDFVGKHGLQIGINANFSHYVSGPNMNLLNIAASDGDVYSPFYAGWPGINVTADNRVDLVTAVPENISHDPPYFFSGYDPEPGVSLHNTIGGNELILSGGKVVATWEDGLHPRTAAGITADGKLLLMTVDGRNPGHSRGMSTAEVARVLRQYGALHGINLDGGGSTTLIFADPAPRVVNIPVGIGNEPGTERYVGNNFGVFAGLRDEPLAFKRLFADFDHIEEIPTPNGALFLRRPSYSGSTAGNLAPSPDVSVVVGGGDVPPGSQRRRALGLRWAFRPELTHPWLRVSAHSAPKTVGRPIISFEKPVQFDIHSNRDLEVLLLVRNTTSTGDYGATGTASGGFEFIGGPAEADGRILTLPPGGKRVRSGEWATLRFDIPNESVTGWDVNNPDLDGNGILETPRGVIESLVFLPVQDGDGGHPVDPFEVYLNHFQIVENSSPPVSSAGVQLTPVREGAALRIEIEGVADTAYTVEVSPDLTEWTPAETVYTDGAGTAVFRDADVPGKTRRFYRVTYPEGSAGQGP